MESIVIDKFILDIIEKSLKFDLVNTPNANSKFPFP